jgi:dTDP-4-dehydrorhamnose reductase
VDSCEKEVELCCLLNRDAVGWMAEPGIPMVHLSTDYIFNGSSGPYREDDVPEPMGVYGKTKLESEPLVLNACSKSIIVRTMTLWGRGNKLRPSFVDFVKNSLQDGTSINIVTDQIGNPTLASDLATAIWKLIDGSFSGVYHVCGSELVSRYDWAVKTAEYYGLNTNLIQPCLTEDLGQAALRPLNSGFILDKLIRDTGFVPKNVSEQLQAAD